MRVCLNCGKNIRDGADFCTSCGAPAPAPEYNAEATRTEDASYTQPGGAASGQTASAGLSTDVPLITLAPERNPFSKQRLIRTGKMVLATTVVIILAVAAVFIAAIMETNPGKENPFTETTLSTEAYSQCRALVNDVRNDNFELIINDVIQMEGDFEDYNFLSRYEELFKGIVPDDSSDKTAVLYRDCCFFVAYSEFLAKKFENYASSGLLSSLYLDDAEMYRSHADTLWNKLENAQTEEHLQLIIDYCAEHNIIYRKADLASASDAA
ncbi:MAG: zinc ribbon domain-containing protein [Ruminococcaceae bacterium]|nr:zinc ribbon domain-containing protein [Oscillospiraceae bacterium]